MKFCTMITVDIDIDAIVARLDQLAQENGGWLDPDLVKDEISMEIPDFVEDECELVEDIYEVIEGYVEIREEEDEDE